MNILLTGGTGYIGSHTAVELACAGHRVVLYDSLCNSSASVAGAIAEITGVRLELVVGDVRDRNLMTETLRRHGIDAVIHFAGLKAVGESCSRPLDYFDNNVIGTVRLLEAMQESGVKKIIFSSSATVYGTPKYLPFDEEHPTGNVTNPYGRTKVMVEQVLADLCASGSPFTAVCLRYFNPIGAHPSGLIGENPSDIPNNLLPYVARVASGRLPAVQIFGNDYPTRDGTGERDFVHVVDLARGHTCALGLLDRITGWEAVNLGTGRACSVLEVIRAYEKACGHSLPCRVMPRRPGDLPAYWANPAKAEKLLGWKAEFGIDEMCRDSWNYERRLAGLR